MARMGVLLLMGVLAGTVSGVSLAEFQVPVVGAQERRGASGRLPTVLMHGMGDSCFNAGMKSITKAVGDNLGSYSVCIPTGATREKDTMNGFFMTMNENVEVFAAKVRADPELAQGFNAIGFSQGNSVIRGYIQKYNNPPVSTFLSVHGTVMGVAGFPNCSPSGLRPRVQADRTSCWGTRRTRSRRRLPVPGGLLPGPKAGELDGVPEELADRGVEQRGAVPLQRRRTRRTS
eukprot:Sspe_Gene.31098::Locus_15353_Transcript_1_1_Confidence_1.000_Length_962::g.31098::m.31098/K01074/PPT; palmitoyl-protein thioesterase